VDVTQGTLTGVVERDPFTKTSATRALVSLTVRVTEVNPSGQACEMFVLCEVYGQVTTHAEQLHAGDAVLVAGKLKWSSWTAKCSGLRTKRLRLANSDTFRPTISANKKASGLRLIANGPALVCKRLANSKPDQQLPLYPKDPIRPMSAGSRGAHCVPQESRLTPPAHRESKQGMILWNFWPPLG
jgi:single-stranded DNA-binding protein